MSMSSFQKIKVSGYIGQGKYRHREAYVYALAHNKYAAQAIEDNVGPAFRLGEFSTEEEAEMACEDYVLGVPYD